MIIKKFNTRSINFFFLVCLNAALVFTMLNCEKDESYDQAVKYQQWVREELSKGIRQDSLFLGYRFGMTRDEFYKHSWELNQKGIVMQGNNNQSVKYEVRYLKHPAAMNFYPHFKEEKIYRMPIVYAYDGWAPWNRDLWADSLEVDLLRSYKKRYGSQFIKMEHPELNIPSHIAINGNQRIAIYKGEDNRTVAVVFTDLSVFNENDEKQLQNPGK